MAWYRTGSVTVTNGSTTVSGSGTDFSANARVGDAFIGPNGALHEVVNIPSPTALSISPAYGGVTAAGASYGIVPVQGYVKQLVDKAGQIVEQWGSTLAGLGPLASATVAQIANGGTGSTTAAGARAALGLGSAATRAVGTGDGELLERGAFGLGSTSAAAATFTGRTGFSTFPASASPVSSAGGVKITQNVGGNLYSEFVITADSFSAPTVAVRQFDGAGSPGVWNKFYTTGNTTRAADGTLKAI